MASRLLTNISTSDIRVAGLKIPPGGTEVVTAPLTAEETLLVSRNYLSDASTADPAALSLSQTFIPVVDDFENMHGLFAIANTAFDGTETTLALAAGSVAIELYELPDSNIRTRQIQYMRAKFSHANSVVKAWESYAEFIPYKDVAMSEQWINTGSVQRRDQTDGALIQALREGSTAVISVPVVGAPTVTTPAALSLVANAPFANEPGIVFFDFNWIAEFEAIFPTSEAASIIVTGQPAEGDFRAFVMGNAQPVVGMITNNTVRIVKTVKGNVAAGLRTFSFTISDHLGSETPVVLNVTVS